MVRISIAMARTLAVLAMLSTFVVSPVLANETDDKAAIQTILRQTWDKPDAPLMVGPVVVSSGYAVAGWTQGDMGGRALLRNEDGKWTVMLCAGDALLSDAALRQIGLPSQIAKSLVTEVRGAEASADPGRVAKFNAFQGIVQMENHGAAKH